MYNNRGERIKRREGTKGGKREEKRGNTPSRLSSLLSHLVVKKITENERRKQIEIKE